MFNALIETHSGAEYSVCFFLFFGGIINYFRIHKNSFRDGRNERAIDGLL